MKKKKAYSFLNDIPESEQIKLKEMLKVYKRSKAKGNQFNAVIFCVYIIFYFIFFKLFIYIIILCVYVCVSVCTLPGHVQHITYRLFSEHEVVTPYHLLSTWLKVVVFINPSKVDAGCVIVVKLLGAWQHVKKT